MKLKYLAVGVFSLVFATFGANPAVAKGSELKFHSSVIAISQSDGDDGTVDVMIHDIVVGVIVNGDTEIGESGEEIGLEDLSVGDFVRVNAFFSDTGLVADEIEVLDVRHEQFRFRGEISAVGTLGDDTVVTLLGVDVIIGEDTAVTRRGNGDGIEALASDIIVGDLANISGGVSDGFLLAHRVHVGTREQGNIELEGEVLEYSDTQLIMELEGGAAVPVMFDDATSIVGELGEGVFIEVEGQLQADLSLLAFEVVADRDGDGDADDDHERGKRGDSNSTIGRCKPGMPRPAVVGLCDKFDFDGDDGERKENDDEREEGDDNKGDDRKENANDKAKEDDERKNDDAKEEKEREENDESDEAREEDDDGKEVDGDVNEEDDNDGDKEDANVESVEVGAETFLGANDGEVEGFAGFHYEAEGGFVEQELKLVLEGVEPGGEFEVLVYLGDMVVILGVVESNQDGVIRVEFESGTDAEGESIDGLLPEGMDVRDITAIGVLQGDEVLVAGEFD